MSRVGRNRRRNMKREDRLAQVIEMIWAANAGGGQPTVAMIAERLEMSSAGYIRGLFKDLMELGLIWRTSGQHWNGQERFTWRVSVKDVQRKAPEVYNHCMQAYGRQMELPIGIFDLEDIPF